MDLSVFDTSSASRALNRSGSGSSQPVLDNDFFSNVLLEVAEIPEQDRVSAIDTLDDMHRDDEIDTADRDTDEDSAGSDGGETSDTAQNTSGTAGLNPLAILLNTQVASVVQASANGTNGADAKAATVTAGQQMSGVLAAKDATALASQSGEARTLNKRAQVLQANENHVQGVKGQQAGAAEQKAAQAENSTKASTATPNAATTGPETGNAGREISRLEQALRQAFPTAAAETTNAPAQNAAAAASATRPGADTLLATRSADPVTDASSNLASSADRPSALATAKAAANRPVFNLPNGRPAEQVSVQVQNGIRNGNDRIHIKLSPAALGNVEVKLELGPDKTVQAIVYADKAETLDMLERDARILQKALEEAGLRTNSDSLSFAQRDSGGSANAQADAGDRPGHDNHAGDSSSEGDDPSNATLIETQTRRVHDGLIDIEA